MDSNVASCMSFVIRDIFVDRRSFRIGRMMKSSAYNGGRGSLGRERLVETILYAGGIKKSNA